MTLNTFLNIKSKIANSELPGIDSQFKMAPAIRKKLGKVIDVDTLKPKRAAVMALLYASDEGDLKMIFILRKTYEGVHSNQVGFPGGKTEEQDNNLLDTALRETEEEIGLHRSQIQVIKELTDVYIPPSNFLVKPFLGVVSKPFQYVIDDYEVEQILEFSVADILNEQNVGSESITNSYANNLTVPSFKFGESVIWGATAMMLSEIKDLLALATD